MTDAERLEEWYKKQGILQGVEFHFANIYDVGVKSPIMH